MALLSRRIVSQLRRVRRPVLRDVSSGPFMKGGRQRSGATMPPVVSHST